MICDIRKEENKALRKVEKWQNVEKVEVRSRSGVRM